ncbi:MAG: histidinol dehydrogenase [Chloroflexi bacterium]|nr:histidinol dehydrogenase [Chloroflexota bacterium]
MSFPIYDTATALAGILRRRPPDETALSDEARAGLRRVFGRDLSADEAVRTILDDVRHEGDAAVRRYTALFDGAEPAALEVTPDEIAAATAALDPAELDAWRLAVEQVEVFHRHQARSGWLDMGPDGALGQIVRPLAKVGLYAPGGRNAYPSSLLMAAAPARVAGVGEVIVCTPPRPDGSPRILAVAGLCGVDRVFRIGGAQAIAALAYGTATVPRVDKVLGPGNIFVALAKRQVFGQVAIDQLAGPTETMVIADDSAAPATVAADLLAQAEHDPMASAILLTPSRALAEAVAGAVERQLAALPRREIAGASLTANGGAVVVDDIPAALALANEYAPEHLCLLMANPWQWLDQVVNAGGVFVGDDSFEVMGDYIAGPSHIMPTGGTARFSSPVHVGEFLKITSVVALNRRGLGRLGPAAARLARAEGLDGHAAAVEARAPDGV